MKYHNDLTPTHNLTFILSTSSNPYAISIPHFITKSNPQSLNFSKCCLMPESARQMWSWWMNMLCFIWPGDGTTPSSTSWCITNSHLSTRRQTPNTACHCVSACWVLNEHWTLHLSVCQPVEYQMNTKYSISWCLSLLGTKWTRNFTVSQPGYQVKTKHCISPCLRNHSAIQHLSLVSRSVLTQASNAKQCIALVLHTSNAKYCLSP